MVLVKVAAVKPKSAVRVATTMSGSWSLLTSSVAVPVRVAVGAGPPVVAGQGDVDAGGGGAGGDRGEGGGVDVSGVVVEPGSVGTGGERGDGPGGAGREAGEAVGAVGPGGGGGVGVFVADGGDHCDHRAGERCAVAAWVMVPERAPVGRFRAASIPVVVAPRVAVTGSDAPAWFQAWLSYHSMSWEKPGSTSLRR